MVIITLTAFVTQLRPPPCNLAQHCIPNTKSQLWLLLMGLSWLGIGIAGIKPCSIPFGIDQFDSSTVEGRLATHSFLNWYYTSATVVVLINQIFVVYIQESVSWALGFGIPALLMMLCAIPLFLVRSNICVHVKPEAQKEAYSSALHKFLLRHTRSAILSFSMMNGYREFCLMLL